MNKSEFDHELAELELRLERLRSLYEQYFLGIERIEPGVARKDVDRRIWALRKVRTNNTAKRFRLQGIIQRYNTLQQYWTRTCKQIENGTYRRHVARAERRFGSNAEPVESHDSFAPTRQSELPPSKRESVLKQTELDLERLLDENVDSDKVTRDALEAAFKGVLKAPGDEGRSVLSPPRTPTDLFEPPQAGPPAPKEVLPQTASARRTGRRPEPSAQAQTATHRSRGNPQQASEDHSSLADATIERLYRELVAEKRKVNPNSRVDRAALARSLRATDEKLRAQYTGRNVDFRVEVRDGRPQIKPVVR